MKNQSEFGKMIKRVETALRKKMEDHIFALRNRRNVLDIKAFEQDIKNTIMTELNTTLKSKNLPGYEAIIEAARQVPFGDSNKVLADTLVLYDEKLKAAINDFYLDESDLVKKSAKDFNALGDRIPVLGTIGLVVAMSLPLALMQLFPTIFFSTLGTVALISLVALPILIPAIYIGHSFMKNSHAFDVSNKKIIEQTIERINEISSDPNGLDVAINDFATLMANNQPDTILTNVNKLDDLTGQSLTSAVEATTRDTAKKEPKELFKDVLAQLKEKFEEKSKLTVQSFTDKIKEPVGERSR
jgi:hypothetical protein